MTRQKKRAKWEREIASWRASGLSQAAYAGRRGLSPASLSYWARKVAADSAPAAPREPEPQGAFVPVEVRQGSAWQPVGGEGVGCPVAVLTCGGAELVIDAAVSPEWLAALMREVGRC